MFHGALWLTAVKDTAITSTTHIGRHGHIWTGPCRFFPVFSACQEPALISASNLLNFLDRLAGHHGTRLAEGFWIEIACHPARRLKMQKAKPTTLPMLLSAVVIGAFAITPALAKDSKHMKSSHSSPKAAAETAGPAPEQNHTPKTVQHDSQPGPAWRTIGGTVKNVHGDIYTVEDYDGNRVTLRVGQGTKQINKKKVGDTFRAEITRGGFANSIQ
jgi:hypothetical protein